MNRIRRSLCGVLVLLAACLLAGGPAVAATLDEALSQVAVEMVNGAKLASGSRNLAVVQFTAAAGDELHLGDYIGRKVRIRMFDADRDRSLRFVSQGKVLDILVQQGMKNTSVIFDETQRIKLGQLLTADLFVHGTYELLGGGQVEIVSYLVEVRSGVTLAQSLRKAVNIPPHLLQPVSAPATTARYARITAARPASDPEAQKKYRMAEVFGQRGRHDRERELLQDVIRDYPQSQEAVFAQMRIMTEDLAQLRSDREYNEDFYQVVATLPPGFRSHSLYGGLRVGTLEWLIELARYEFSSGGQEEVALDYLAKAKSLGMSADQARDLDDLARAARIRAAIRAGNRDNAELMLVEWEVDRKDSPLRKMVQKEFERGPGMVTIPSGDVNGLKVDAFNLDKYETTNAEFLEFVKANPAYRKSRMTADRNDRDYLSRWSGDFSYSEHLHNIPVVFVSAIVAEAYCKWRGKRLPSSQEWGLAAGEGRRTYPWGDRAPDAETANFDKGLAGDPMPGDSHPKGATPEGVMHMGGNVWESTSTRNGPKAISRGGSYFDNEKILRNSSRDLAGDSPTYSSRFLGLRCAK